MSKEICNCENDNFIQGEGSFDLSGRFVNTFAPEFENPRFNIVSGKIQNLNTNRSNCDTTNCNPTKQQKLSVRHKPTPYRVPYNHYRKRFTCITDCSTNVKIIKEKTCDINCQKTTYGITRLVNKTGVRLRNNGGDYMNYLQSMGKTHNQHSVGIIPEFRSNNDPNSYKIKNDGFVFNQNHNTVDNSNCGIFGQKPDGLYSQTFDKKKIPTAVRKYKNKGFSTNSSVSSKNRLLQLKYNTTLAGQLTKDGYNNCVNGELCSLYQQSGPNTKMRTHRPTCKRFNFKGRRQSCFIYRNPNLAGIVSIGGVTVKGNILNAVLFDSNSYSMSGITYQWLRNNIDIGGAVYQGYRLVDNDVGKQIKVRIKYVDNQGYLETVTSQPTKNISATNFTGTVSIIGQTVKHQDLTVNIVDSDSPITNISYQWIRVYPDDEELILLNTNKDIYKLVHGDVGNKIKVRITYTDNNNLVENITSSLTDVITFPPQEQGTIIINGEMIKGKTLETVISDDNGISTPYIEYKWIRVYPETGFEVYISNVTNSYLLTDIDVGQKFKVEARYIDNDSYINNIISSVTDTIVQPTNQPGSVSISGTNIKEQTLTANVTDLNGISGEIIYQWSRKDGDSYSYIGSPITGQLNTNNTYTLVNDDVGKNIIVNVKYTDDDMYYTDISSNQTALIAQPADIIGTVTISGVAKRDIVLTANVTDENNISTTITYQWIRIDGDTETNISGANNNQYTVVQDDVYKKIKVNVQYTDDDNHSQNISSIPTSNIVAVNSLGIITITGVMKKKQTISAIVTDVNGVPSTITYQWIRINGTTETNIGQNSPNYTLVIDDIGFTIKVRAQYIDNNLFFENIVSNQTSTILNADNITGTINNNMGLPILGETLTAIVSDSNGLPDVINYQWIRVDDSIETNIGTNNNTYTIVEDDVSNKIKVNVTYTDLDDYVENLTSQITNTIDMSGAIVVSGNPVTEQILTATVTDTNNIKTITTQNISLNNDNKYIWNNVTGNPFPTITLERKRTYTIGIDVTGYPVRLESDSTTLYSQGITHNDGTTDTTGATAVTDKSSGTWTWIVDENAPDTLYYRSTNHTDISGIINIIDENLITYQWIRVDGSTETNIGTNNNQYTIVNDDAGKTIKVNAQYKDLDGFDENITSLNSNLINDVGVITISGTTKQNETLTANINDVNGTSGTIIYQWIRINDSTEINIPNSDNINYILQKDDSGNTIKVNAQYTDNNGFNENITSTETSLIFRADNVTGTVTVSGLTSVGQTLTTSISDNNGLPEIIDYQWSRNDVEITDASNSTYTLVDADATTVIKVDVSYNDLDNYPQNITSLGTNPINKQGSVAIAGTLSPNQTLTATVTDVNGTTDISYIWIRVVGGTETIVQNILNQNTYVVQSQDSGNTIKVNAKYTDAHNYDENIFSSETDTINTLGTIDISGIAIVNNFLEVQINDVNGISGTVTYQWIRVDGGSETSIGTNNNQYTIVSDDIAKTIKVNAQYTDDVGFSENITSTETLPVNTVGSVTITGNKIVGQTLNASVNDVDGIQSIAAETITTYDISYNLANNAYIFKNDPSTLYPTINLRRGETYTINIDVTSAHPIRLQTTTGLNGDLYGDGLSHSDGTTGISAATNKINGNWTWTIPQNAPNTLYYRCQNHTNMIGTINIINSIIVNYQWIRVDGATETNIGINSPNYTIVAADTDKTIKVNVQYIDNKGYSENITSDATTIINSLGNVVISGEETVDNILTAIINDLNGSTNASYQWIRVDDVDANNITETNITDATNPTYTLVTADYGKKIKVNAQYTDNGGFSENITSATTRYITKVNITGTTTVGEQLSVTFDDIQGITTETITTYDISYNLANNAYILENDISTLYPTINLRRGETYTINIDVTSAHPIRLQSTTDLSGTLYSDGLSHSDGTIGIQSAENKINGFWTLTINENTPEILYYRCRNHTNMIGTINILDNYINYQWINVDTDNNEFNIGDNSDNYILINEDGGDKIKINIRYTDISNNSSKTINSILTNEISQTGNVAITGITSPGEVLTATITDSNGIPIETNLQQAISYNAADNAYIWNDISSNLYPTITLERGRTYTIDIDVTDNHPVRIQTNSDLNGTLYSDGLTHSSGNTGDDIHDVSNGTWTWTIPQNAPNTLYYRCKNHTDMSGNISIVDKYFNYQWIRVDGTNETNIGTNNNEYTIVNADISNNIKVNVQYTDNLGVSENITSVLTNIINTPPTLNITGTTHVGQVLTANLTDNNGFVDVQYIWIRVDGSTETTIQNILNQNTYTLVEEDGGKTIKVNAQYTDNNNFGENIMSSETLEINGDGKVEITGISAKGQQLTAVVTDTNGINGTITYQWIRTNDANSSTNIGINSPNYTSVEDDIGKTIKVQAQYTDNLNKIENIESTQTKSITDSVVFDQIINNNNESYRFTEYPVNYQDNIQLTLTHNITYIFKVNTPGHPFYIKTERIIGTEYQYNGVIGQGTEVGTVVFRVPYEPIPDNLYYISGNTTYGLNNVAKMSGILHIP